MRELGGKSRGFLTFVREKGRLWLLVGGALLGVLLLLFGGFHTDTDETQTVDTVQARVAELAAYEAQLEKEIRELCDRIEAFALSRLGATRGEAPSVDEVGELYKRNGSREWLLSERRFLTEYSVSRRRAYPFGVVQAEMTLLGDVIEGIALSGDFFGARPVEELEAALVGRPCEAVLSLPVSRYIDGMAREELYALLTDC